MTKGNAAAKRRLRLELGGEDGPGELARDVARRLATIGRSKGVVDWQRAPALIADLEMQRRAIIERIAPAWPNLGFYLIWCPHALSTGTHLECPPFNCPFTGLR